MGKSKQTFMDEESVKFDSLSQEEKAHIMDIYDRQFQELINKQNKKEITMKKEKDYTTGEIMEMFGISKATLYRWLYEGKLHAHRVGGRWYVSETELENSKRRNY